MTACDKYSIKKEIEKLRMDLEKLVNTKRGDLLHPEVIRLSQYLDQLIVRYMEKN